MPSRALPSPGKDRLGHAGSSGEPPLGSRTVFRVGTALAILVLSTGGLAGASGESFRAAVDAAMLRMHRGMALAASGDADRDFAARMIPHHQGAIEMAELQLLHGSDERLRRLAQGIIVEQTQEIAAMRHVLANLDGRRPVAGRGALEASELHPGARR